MDLLFSVFDAHGTQTNPYGYYNLCKQSTSPFKLKFCHYSVPRLVNYIWAWPYAWKSFPCSHALFWCCLDYTFLASCFSRYIMNNIIRLFMKSTY